MFLSGILIFRKTLQSIPCASAVPTDLIYPDELALEGGNCLVSIFCLPMNEPDIFLALVSEGAILTIKTVLHIPISICPMLAHVASSEFRNAYSAVI